MIRHGILVFVTAVFLLARPETSPAATFPSYVNCAFVTGSNLFNNPLEVRGTSATNTLSELFGPATPFGTTVALWNSGSLSFNVTSVFNGSWSTNLVLRPGTGALVMAPVPFTNTIAGLVLDHAGNLVTNDAGLIPVPPPLFGGRNGTYLFGDKMPLASVGTNIFVSLLGRPPNVGEQVTQLSGTSTYLGNGIWDSIPTLLVGRSAFLKIISDWPSLTIVCSNSQVIVSWPTNATGWILQTNSTAAPNGWGTYAGLVTTNRTTHSTVMERTFFRLWHP